MSTSGDMLSSSLPFLIRPITPTDLPLIQVCLPNHLHAKLSITLCCPLKIIWLSPAFQIDIKMFPNTGQELFRLVTFL